MRQEASGLGELLDLASEAMGGEALLASDEFFAEKENLLKAGRGVFIPDRYTERGKWMDGWESRRRRTPGHDWCIVRLGVPGHVQAVDIDTHHFTGNYPAFASVDACHAPGASPAALRDEVTWTRIVAQQALRGGSQHLLPAAGGGPWTHVRLNIHPDGGVARLRVYGRPAVTLAEGQEVNLLARELGARALWCSDMTFADMNNLLLPGVAPNMGSGWETRRSRPPGQDRVILALACPGRVREIEVDTRFFKGNFPDRCAVEGLHWEGAPPAALLTCDLWRELLPPTRLQAHALLRFPLADHGPLTHLSLRILPDGGVSRLRARGVVDTSPPPDAALARLDGLAPEDLSRALSRACGARRWVAGMAGRAPFRSRARLLGEAEDLWWHLDEADWREAFTHHPRIGADPEALRARFGATAAWSAREQAGVAEADEALLAALAEGNRAYEARHGFIFIVCAAGLGAAEMARRLDERLHNPPEVELRLAAGEQARITRLRLLKLLEEHAP